MNAKNPTQSAAYRSAGAIPEISANAAVLLLCAALVTLTLTAALLLLTLPGALDAIAVSAPVISADAVQIDERQAGQVIADWVDAPNGAKLATWRLRSSD